MVNSRPRTLAVSFPIPLFAPVTSMTFPERSGMWFTLNFAFGGNIWLYIWPIVINDEEGEDWMNSDGAADCRAYLNEKHYHDMLRRRFRIPPFKRGMQRTEQLSVFYYHLSRVQRMECTQNSESVTAFAGWLREQVRIGLFYGLSNLQACAP